MMQYSKFLPITTGIIFISTLLFCMTHCTMENYTLYVTTVTTTGGCFGSAIIWYMKKSQAENVYKLKKDLYKTVNEEQIKYQKSVLELKQKYKVDDPEIEHINFDSQLDEMKMQALNDTDNQIDTAMSDATSLPNQITEVQI